jgi:ketosteroid isomerase-like protein
MAITTDYVREIFQGLERGDGVTFLQHVDDDVDWTVMGPQLWSYPRFGRALSREEREPPGDFVLWRWWLRHADGRFP